MFRYTANILLSLPSDASSSSAPQGNDLVAMAQSQVVLLSLFYDLTFQDLPPVFEDNNAEFFGSEQGWFVRFLQWDPAQLAGDVSDIAVFVSEHPFKRYF